MNDFTLLKELLNKDALVPIQDRQAKLKEKGRDGKSSYVVDLEDLPDDTLILISERFPQPNKVFDCTKKNGICKRADYVVVNEKEMIFIELKRYKGDNDNIKNQLRGAQCVMDYCVAIGERFFDCPEFMEKAVENPHFVCIMNIGQKQPSILTAQSPNNTPETMLELTGENFQYKQLLG